MFICKCVKQSYEQVSLVDLVRICVKVCLCLTSVFLLSTYVYELVFLSVCVCLGSVK
jgi:hypothetical protein